MPPVSDLEIYYKLMLERFGPRNWWPGDSPFEIALGAVLVQNTAWSNVDRAMDNLKALGPLTPAAVAALPGESLALAIRPSGYYNQKAVKVRNLLGWFRKYSGEDSNDPSLGFLRGENFGSLRESLLAVKGVGPETADAILLYALGLPAFVVDAYTWRMLRRHGFVGDAADYYEMQSLFTSALPEDAAVYNECHALIVKLGQEHCRRTNPVCESCPLFEHLDYPVFEE